MVQPSSLTSGADSRSVCIGLYSVFPPQVAHTNEPAKFHSMPLLYAWYANHVSLHASCFLHAWKGEYFQRSTCELFIFFLVFSVSRKATSLRRYPHSLGGFKQIEMSQFQLRFWSLPKIHTLEDYQGVLTVQELTIFHLSDT